MKTNNKLINIDERKKREKSDSEGLRDKEKTEPDKGEERNGDKNEVHIMQIEGVSKTRQERDR